MLGGRPQPARVGARPWPLHAVRRHHEGAAAVVRQDEPLRRGLDAPCFDSDAGRVKVGATKVMQFTTSYRSNARVIPS